MASGLGRRGHVEILFPFTSLRTVSDLGVTELFLVKNHDPNCLSFNMNQDL